MRKEQTYRFSDLQKHLLDDYQQQLPLSLTPYADMANQLGVTEQEVLQSLQTLHQDGVISRIGPVFTPNRVGVSTLVAMSIPDKELECVARIVSAFAEVNHNYERQHHFNLWFVVTASSEQHLEQVLQDIEMLTEHSLMPLPMLEDFHIDLGFKIAWA